VRRAAPSSPSACPCSASENIPNANLQICYNNRLSVAYKGGGNFRINLAYLTEKPMGGAVDIAGRQR
jgi:hypothetical protein